MSRTAGATCLASPSVAGGAGARPRPLPVGSPALRVRLETFPGAGFPWRASAIRLSSYSYWINSRVLEAKS
jgi:hypothetical protein